MKLVQLLKKSICDLISPPECASCKEYLEERTLLCTVCRLLIQPVVSYALSVTERYIVPVYSLSAYRDPLRKLILAKMRGDRTMSVVIGQLMAEHTFFRHQEYDVLVPVPLHWRRYAQRGFNQAQVISQYIGHTYNKPVCKHLKRVRHTLYQSALNASAREENIKDAFMISAAGVRMCTGKRLVIIDDLFTTGATVRAVIKALLPARPASIVVVVACRVTPGD